MSGLSLHCVGMGGSVPKPSQVHSKHQTAIQERGGGTGILRKQTAAGEW